MWVHSPPYVYFPPSLHLLTSYSTLLIPSTMCPPGTDQTTRTEERWTLLAPALEEKYKVTNDLNGSYNLDLHKLLNGDFTWDAFDKLARYRRDGARAHAIVSTLPYRFPSSYPSHLEILPAEIISMILMNPDLEPRDIVSVGLSCRLLWTNVLEHIIRKCQSGPWAGTPLLCTGTWTMSLPRAIHALRPELEQEEQEFFDRPGRGPKGCPVRGTCPARQFNWHAYDEYVGHDEQISSSIWTKRFSTAGQNAAIPQPYLNVLRQSLETVTVVKRSTLPKSWLLRNHTTKECISLKTGPTSSKQEQHVHVKGVPWLTLDKALLLRICWSASHAAAPWGEDDDEIGDVRHRAICAVKQGKWAGHCFDVVPRTELSAPSGEGWSDVTQSVAKKAVAWKTMFKHSRDEYSWD